MHDLWKRAVYGEGGQCMVRGGQCTVRGGSVW